MSPSASAKIPETDTKTHMTTCDQYEEKYQVNATTPRPSGSSGSDHLVPRQPVQPAGRRCLFGTDLKLGADGGPSAFGAALQSVLFVATQHVFEEVVDKVQPDKHETHDIETTDAAQKKKKKNRFSPAGVFLNYAAFVTVTHHHTCSSSVM